MKILLKITQRPNFDNLRKHENNYTEKESDIEHVNHQFASQDASKTGATIYIIIFLNNSTYYQSEQKKYPPSNCCKKKKRFQNKKLNPKLTSEIPIYSFPFLIIFLKFQQEFSHFAHITYK